MQTLKLPKNSLEMFHINACSLSQNFEDLEYLLNSTNFNYNIAISETRIIKNIEITKNFKLTLKKYNFEYIPTESTNGGTMLCTANHLSYKPRHDLKIYYTNELE